MNLFLIEDEPKIHNNRVGLSCTNILLKNGAQSQRILTTHLPI